MVRLDDEWTGLLPELSRLPPLKLPATIEAASQQFQAAGISLDPRQIDLYQLAGLWCRVLSGEPAGAYLRSPRVKALVPGALRPLLERSLGANGRQRFADAHEFLAELDIIADRFPELHKRPPPVADLQIASPIQADHRVRESGDTTPSFLSSKKQVADTAIAGPAVQEPEESALEKSALDESALGEAAARGRDSHTVLPFARMGHYEIRARIGQGGMGE